MKFSVIIPLYNKAPYVRKALETVCAQTYRDYEIIVINDGSTDNSAIIAEEFLNSVEGINYKILQQKNAGVAAARNNGVAQASGDYIAFLDADDWWEPTYLERMAQLIADYPEAGLYTSNYYYHKDGVNIVKVDIPTGYFNYPKEYFNNFAMPVWTGATMVPNKVFNKMEGFPLGIKLGEDFLMWARIALQYKVAFLNEPLAYYNNTIPPNYRATYHLHKPEEHMLFRLELVFGNEEIMSRETDWKRLIDMLRLLGLHSYWLSDEYHALAQREIDKVDMSQQHDFLVKLYRLPRWVQKIKQQLLQLVSRIKHILKLVLSKCTAKAEIIVDNKQYRKTIFKD